LRKNTTRDAVTRGNVSGIKSGMCFLGKRNSKREEQQKQKKIFIADKKINNLLHAGLCP
jgi:hypothetical protein